jgi:putative ABC transport system substrate-binding protein
LHAIAAQSWGRSLFPAARARLESFRRGLREQGYVEGRNVAIELRYAERGPQQLPELAAELVRLNVDVILASGDFAPKGSTAGNGEAR